MRAEKGQDRQRDDQRQHPRQDQNLDRVEAHGAQRVDLLAHLHRAEFGGIGAAGTARHHDRHQQHADLAQHQDAQHVDHEDIRAEFAEMKDALLGDDAADQKGDQHDDRHRAPAHLLEMMHGRGQAEALGVDHDPAARGEHRAEHVDQADDGGADAGHAAADLIQHPRNRHRGGVDRRGRPSPGAPRRPGSNNSPKARRSLPPRRPGSGCGAAARSARPRTCRAWRPATRR